MQKLISRKLNRLKNYNYSDDGRYLITVCSKNRENIFGEYDNKIVGEGLAPSRYKDNIKLSKLGQIIDKQWNDIENQYDVVILDQYIIMPNHIHGILIINKRTGASPVPTVSNIIGTFKSKTSVEYLQYIKKNNLHIPGLIWQRSFYDHVIRNDASLQNIREYIVNNPLKWDDDENNPVNFNKTVRASFDRLRTSCLNPTG